MAKQVSHVHWQTVGGRERRGRARERAGAAKEKTKIDIWKD